MSQDTFQNETLLKSVRRSRLTGNNENQHETGRWGNKKNQIKQPTQKVKPRTPTANKNFHKTPNSACQLLQQNKLHGWNYLPLILSMLVALCGSARAWSIGRVDWIGLRGYGGSMTTSSLQDFFFALGLYEGWPRTNREKIQVTQATWRSRASLLSQQGLKSARRQNREHACSSPIDMTFLRNGRGEL